MKLTRYNSIKSHMQMSTNAAMNQDSESLKSFADFHFTQTLSVLREPSLFTSTRYWSAYQIQEASEGVEPRGRDHLTRQGQGASARQKWLNSRARNFKPKCGTFPCYEWFYVYHCISLSLSICIYCRCIYALFFSSKDWSSPRLWYKTWTHTYMRPCFSQSTGGGKPEGPVRKALELARLCGVERSRTDLHAMYGEATYSHSNVYAPPRKYTS